MKKRRSFLKLLLLGGVSYFFYNKEKAKAYYSGPVSDHFNGVTFFDKEGAEAKSFLDLIKWNIDAIKNRKSWNEVYPVKQKDVPPQRSKNLRLSFIGHASWLYQVENLNILIDPIFSERVSPVSFLGPKRVTETGVDFTNLPPIDFVLITHNHYDHLDIETLKRLEMKYNPRFIAPLGNDTIIKEAIPTAKCEPMDWGDALQLSSDVKLFCEPCRHWSARGIFDRNKALWAAFAFEAGDKKLLHIGDTGYGSGAYFHKLKAKFGWFDVSIIPIGAYEPRWFMKDQHINPEEAVQVYQDTNTKIALASHWGTFQLTDEGREEPPDALAKALAIKNLTSEQFKLLQVGEVFNF